MTVETTKARWRYTGDGSSVSFAYTNKITAAADLLVYLDGLLQGSGYSVSNVGVKTGGNVVFVAAPALNVRIDIVRLVPASQGADFKTSDALPSEKIEAALDRQILVVQDLRALADRALRLAVDADDAGVSLEIPTLIADRVLVVNSEGTGFAFVEDSGALAVVSQAEAQAGSATTARLWTAQRVAQAIAALRDNQALIVAVGDETTAITTGTGKITFRMPYAFSLSAVKASLTTAGTTLTSVDINEGGATILSTKLSIDANETSSATAAAAAVISDAALAADAEITIDIDTAGTSAAGLKVTLIGKPA